MTEKEKGLIAAACGCFLQQFAIDLDTVLANMKAIDKEQGIKRSNDYYTGAVRSFASAAATIEKVCDQIEKNLCPGLYEYMERSISLLEKQVHDILEIGGSNDGGGVHD